MLKLYWWRIFGGTSFPGELVDIVWPLLPPLPTTTTTSTDGTIVVVMLMQQQFQFEKRYPVEPSLCYSFGLAMT